jgi:endonuclease/exonuclease/phosphatase family metal-dependent hydrolase
LEGDHQLIEPCANLDRALTNVSVSLSSFDLWICILQSASILLESSHNSIGGCHANLPKAKFQFSYNVPAEIQNLRAHKSVRQIPARTSNAVLAATWNIANLGAQQRRDEDRSLIAEILSWFDIVAIQECRENFADLDDIIHKLGGSYRFFMSDASGNDERMTFIYDKTVLSPLEEIGEIAFPPSDYRSIKLPGVTQTFNGFDRTPYLASFQFKQTSFLFVNVHLFYGDEKPKSIARRALETFAVAKWADRRHKSAYAFTRELVVMGDFNMPKCQPTDPIFKALTRLGLDVPDHSAQIASSIAGDANYDQIAFFPGTTNVWFHDVKGVFDYDQVIFPTLWENGKGKKRFLSYLRYYISDHRPMWLQLS